VKTSRPFFNRSLSSSTSSLASPALIRTLADVPCCPFSWTPRLVSIIGSSVSHLTGCSFPVLTGRAKFPDECHSSTRRENLPARRVPPFSWALTGTQPFPSSVLRIPKAARWTVFSSRCFLISAPQGRMAVQAANGEFWICSTLAHALRFFSRAFILS